MEKRKIFWILITIVISVLSLLVAIKLIFKSDKINEGKFRVSDVILSSFVEIENKTSVNGKWSIDLSQNNKLSMLIEKANNAEISEITLSGIKANKDGIVVSQIDSENKVILDGKTDNLDIEYVLDDEGYILIELNIMNENLLKNWQVPEGINELIYDGRILKTAGLKYDSIKFNFEFKLNIVETKGKTSSMKVNLTLPYEEMITEGASVRRLSLTNFKFKVV